MANILDHNNIYITAIYYLMHTEHNYWSLTGIYSKLVYITFSTGLDWKLNKKDEELHKCKVTRLIQLQPDCLNTLLHANGEKV